MRKLFFLSLISIFFSVTALFGEELFYTDDNFAPYSYIENGAIKGIDIDIVKEISRRIKLDITIKQVPWKRLLFDTEQGSISGSFSLFKTPEREQYALFATAKPVHYSTYSIFVLKGKTFGFTKISDLYGKRLALPTAFAISDEFDHALQQKKFQAIELDDIDRLILMAKMRRIDGFIANPAVMSFELKKRNQLGKFEVLDKPVKKKRGAFLVISKKGKIPEKEKMIRLINKTLTGMYNDGTVKQINDRYTK